MFGKTYQLINISVNLLYDSVFYSFVSVFINYSHHLSSQLFSFYFFLSIKQKVGNHFTNKHHHSFTSIFLVLKLLSWFNYAFRSYFIVCYHHYHRHHHQQYPFFQKKKKQNHHRHSLWCWPQLNSSPQINFSWLVRWLV